MVMWDLAVDVVSDVSLGDAVGTGGSDPGHDGSKAAKEVAIIGRQSATGEGELAGAIMRKEGVGVLQEGDQHEPVVNPGEALAKNLESGKQMLQTRDKE